LIESVWRVDKYAMDQHKITWKNQYDKLVEFKRKNGHYLLPNKYQEDTSLGNWVHLQRHLHVKNKLQLDGKGLLDDIGFVWRVDKSTHGISTMKRWSSINAKMAIVSCHKFTRKTRLLGFGLITSAKISKCDYKELLDDIGFVWRVEKHAPWEEQYEKLVPGRHVSWEVSNTL
jgi:hypothetical protein